MNSELPPLNSNPASPCRWALMATLRTRSWCGNIQLSLRLPNSQDTLTECSTWSVCVLLYTEKMIYFMFMDWIAVSARTYRWHVLFKFQAMSPDGEAIVTGAGDETLRFWNVFSKTRSTKVRQPFLESHWNPFIIGKIISQISLSCFRSLYQF